MLSATVCHQSHIISNVLSNVLMWVYSQLGDSQAISNSVPSVPHPQQRSQQCTEVSVQPVRRLRLSATVWHQSHIISTILSNVLRWVDSQLGDSQAISNSVPSVPHPQQRSQQCTEVSWQPVRRLRLSATVWHQSHIISNILSNVLRWVDSQLGDSQAISNSVPSVPHPQQRSQQCTEVSWQPVRRLRLSATVWHQSHIISNILSNVLRWVDSQLGDCQAISKSVHWCCTFNNQRAQVEHTQF